MYSGSGSFPAEEMKYLKLLSNQYKNINSAATEIINLKAILNLPKGTSILFPMSMVSWIPSAMYSETHPVLSRTRLVQSLGRACAAVRKNHWQR